MQFLLLGLAALVVVLLLAQSSTGANTGLVMRRLRPVLGTLLLAVAAGLSVRGAAGPASLLALFGGWLIWGRLGGVLGLPGAGTRSPGQTSKIATEYLQVELDHDTGAVRGEVSKGRFAGRRIESLSPQDLSDLWRECQRDDPRSAQVLEAFLDSAHPGWRQRRTDSHGGDGHSAGGDGAMTRDEAYDILGLEPGASEADIRLAHRELMLKMHPDRGGSTYLASKINRAKEVLLG